MTDFMQNAYVFLWAVLAVYMLVMHKRIGAVAFVLSGFFAFMTVWFGLRSFAGIAMFDGTLGIIFRCIVGVFLAALILIYILSKYKSKKDDSSNGEK